MTSSRMPVLFVGHGSPINAIEDNRWSRAFRELGAGLPRPRAILAISAHWYVDGTLLTANPRPETIHDFGGFPKALHEMRYPAPGQPDLAERVRALIGPAADLSTDWGLDHGTWSVLCHTHPRADVPVVQLSIDRRLRPEQHLALARPLRELRDEGVLVLASGNITHNLADAFGRMQDGDTATPDWAERHDASCAAALLQHDQGRLLELWPGTSDGRRSHPTPDHWLPLLYAVAASDDGDQVTFPIDGFDLGSLSMRAVRFDRV